MGRSPVTRDLRRWALSVWQQVAHPLLLDPNREGRKRHIEQDRITVAKGLLVCLYFALNFVGDHSV